MLPMLIVLIAFTVFRLAGAAGVRQLRDWRVSLRYALALMFLVTASGHWGVRRADLVRMVPPAFPSPELLVTLTGLAEIAGAIGLLWTRTARLAAACLTLFLLAVFPANVYAARQQLTIAGKPVTPLPLRTAVQVGLVAATAAIAVSSRHEDRARADSRDAVPDAPGLRTR
ncbi:MAG TPA: DoxX family membrane protein [Thermoanaerobaculia bacterium]|jgi:uncharacterized membrane protein